MLKRILIVVCCLLSLTARGQEDELFFNHFVSDDGLSHNTIYSINQDSAGFLWIGTRSGLNRYDGVRFKLYSLKDGLMDIFINEIFRDSSGRIWVGTQEGGVSLYDYTTDHFNTWIFEDSMDFQLRMNDILAIAEDNEGNIWAGSHGGNLYRLKEVHGEFDRISFVNLNDKNLLPDRIYSIFFQKDGNILIGSRNGLFKMKLVQEKEGLYGHLQHIYNQWITSIQVAENNDIWLGTNIGLVKFTGFENAPEIYNSVNSGLSSNSVNEIEWFDNFHLLVSTDGGGLNLVNTEEETIRAYTSDPNNQYSLSNNSVYDVFIDRDHAIWTGNYMGGLNHYSPEQWKFNLVRHKLNNPESLSDNHVRTFYEDATGSLWIGTLGGLNRYNQSSGEFDIYINDRSVPNSLSSNTVLSIYEPDSKDLWIGTFGGGLNIFDRETREFRLYSHEDDQNNSLQRSSIYQIIGIENKIILATLGGLYTIDRQTNELKRFTVSNSQISSNTLKVLCRDRNGFVWIGTSYGLNRFNPFDNSFKVFTHTGSGKNSLSNNRILCIIESEDGKICIGTEGGGLNILDPQTESFSYLTVNDGLPDNVINSIIEDYSGSFWIASNKGLAKYEPTSEVISIYTIADGLQGNEFYQNSCLISSTGTIFFGGPYGFNYFDPDRMKIRNASPRVKLTELYLSGHLVNVLDEKSPITKQLSLAEDLKLPYHSNFEIHFSVPGTPNQNRFLFSYKLDGYNDDWTEFQKTNFASFASLRPGKYVLMVRAMNNDRTIGEIPASIRISILPPWWKTWWVFIIYAAVIGGLIFILLFLNNSKLKAKHALEIELKEKERDNELHQLKLKFFTDISHEFKTPLTLILGNLDNLKINSKELGSKTFSVIESNAKRLLALINQLLEFRKAESGLMRLQASKGNLVPLLTSIKESFSHLAEKKNIDFNILTAESIPDTWFDKEKIEKIFYNILSNAFKFTPENGKIEIIIGHSHLDGSLKDQVNVNDYLTVTVADSGPGIPQEEQVKIFEGYYQRNPDFPEGSRIEGAGIGLAYTRKLVDLHHGSIKVISEPGKGAQFIILLPVGKDHLSDGEIKEDMDYHLKLNYKEEFEAEELKPLSPVENLGIDHTKPIMLIVEDNPTIQQTLSEKFQERFTVIKSLNGRNGLDKARHFLPDIIISDIMMPEMDGIHLCRLLKTNMITSHIPIILLSVKNEEEDKIQGFDVGADAYITKPYNPDLLMVTVENLLNTRIILRKKYGSQGINVPSELVENKLDEEFLNKLVATIENEKKIDRLEVSMLCNELAMSRSVLYRKVKMLTGKSIQEFIRLVKLRKASSLLINSKMSVSEIAYISGFSNTKHFSTAFKKIFLKTPSDYRVEGG